MNTIQALCNPMVLNGEASVEHYTALWLEAFPKAKSKGRRHWNTRLKELQSWDNCNSKENERQGKINALKSILKLQ